MEDVGKALDTIVLQAVQCVPVRAKGFAPAGATKGLSDRPLETFGPYLLVCLQARKPESFDSVFQLEIAWVFQQLLPHAEPARPVRGMCGQKSYACGA